MEPVIDATNYKVYLSKYSNLVTSAMRSNQFLETKLSNRQKVLDQLKALLIKYSSFSSKIDIHSQLKQDLLLSNEAFKQKNMKLQSDILSIQLKNQSLSTQLGQCNEAIHSKIDKEKDYNFIISNVLMEKEAILNRIMETKLQIEKPHLTKGETEDDKDLSPDDAFDYYGNELDQTKNSLYHESRGVNKHLNKRTKLLKRISELKAEISNHSNSNTNENGNVSLSERKINRNLLSERRGYCDNKTIPDQSNLEDSYANDPSYFDDINLDSDEDNNFEANSFLELIKLDRETILKSIPYLNLKQILFNKENPRPEVDENSIQRRNKIETIADEIDEMKEKIKVMKKVVKNNKKLELNYIINIDKMNKYLLEKSKRKTMLST